MKRKHSENQKSNKRLKLRADQELSTFTTIQSEPEQFTPIQSPSKSQQTQSQSQELNLISNKHLKLKYALNQYNEGKIFIKDYRDTISQLSNIISKDLSISLITWDYELRNQIQIDQNSLISHLNFKSFTLWPLNLKSCPKSEWSLNDEILSCLNRFYFQKDWIQIKFNHQLLQEEDELDEFELNQIKSNQILNQINLTFESILIEFIKYVPRHSINKKDNQFEVLNSDSIQNLDPGLKWKDILNISSKLGIHQNILDRTRNRLEQIYKDTSIFDHPLSQIIE